MILPAPRTCQERPDARIIAPDHSVADLVAVLRIEEPLPFAGDYTAAALLSSGMCIPPVGQGLIGIFKELIAPGRRDSNL
jgi:hypothetical protein